MCPRLTYSAIADNPEGGQAAKVIELLLVFEVIEKV